jgi:hypothetical protein
MMRPSFSFYFHISTFNRISWSEKTGAGKEDIMRCLILIVVCMVILSGCATIPEEQCASIDWYQLGVKDGLAGYREERINQHREACAKVQIIPDKKRYLEGRKVGLVEYCRIDNAIEEGLNGRVYRDVCNESFRRLYKAAYEINSLKRRIRINLDKVSNKEAELQKDKPSKSRREELRSEIRDLDRERESLRDDLYDAERELAKLRRSIMETR